MAAHTLLGLLSFSCTAPSWRTFRANLVTQTRGADASTPASAANIATLRQRSSFSLDEEAVEWAHSTNLPEPGGLLCAMPLQAQLVHQLRNGPVDSSSWAAQLGKQLDASLSDEQLENRDAWLARTPYLYSLATTMANDAFKSMGLSFSAAAARRTRDLWTLQQARLRERKQVCLVLDVVGASSSTASAVSLCTPLGASDTTEARLEVARRLLFGRAADECNEACEVEEEARAERFVEAFGAAAVVYRGGPDGSDEPGLCVHGVPELVQGSMELAEGTGIYICSADSAVEAVLGDNSVPPEAFRFFLGHHADVSVDDGAWCSVACSRGLVLRQNPASLPKPLWHEVLDLAGGDLKEISAAVRVESTEGGRKRRRDPPSRGAASF